jgi:alginate O-acetyltransferase complex protein AlgI
VPSVALPVGISFYTFQAISYLADVHRGDVVPQRNPLYFGAYLAMFPQLIAGPIVRYETIAAELSQRRENLQEFAAGVRRFAIGLGKKVLIANTMGQIADAVLEAGPAVGALPAWYAFVAYAFQIYFDFSGYSDMAIGLGRMFGFHFLENFNYPYIAKSVTDFWRRWHISLSTFFRDYVYISLGGNRVNRGRWVFNVMAVWALTGLWHGARWNFVCWGVYFGVLLIGERLLWGGRLERLPSAVQHLYAVFLFLLGWVIFRIEDFGQMGAWFAALFGGYGGGQVVTLSALNVLHHYPWFLVAAIGATPLVAHGLKRLDEAPVAGWLADAGVMVTMVCSILVLVMDGFNPFLYYRF